ncbi:MAG: IS200/IS605 family transposase [Saprospiraceae bacterium]
MADTFKQAYFHLVFCPKHRESLIHKSWKTDLEKYFHGILTHNKHKSLAITAMPDHVHIFLGYNLNQTIPDLVEHLKTSSNKWISVSKLSPFKFEWQKGYGAFTHSHSNLDKVMKYVMNQEEHHKKVSFKDEYLGLLQKNEIEYKDEYLFDFL